MDRSYVTLDLPEGDNNDEGPNKISEKTADAENGKSNLQDIGFCSFTISTSFCFEMTIYSLNNISEDNDSCV